jgi:hypothetical protein
LIFFKSKVDKISPKQKELVKKSRCRVKTYEEGHVEIRDYLKQVPHFHSALLQRLYP